MSVLVEVAVLVPVAGAFTYALGDGIDATAGARVWVSFAGRDVEGVVLGPPAEAAASAGGRAHKRIKTIDRLVDAPGVDVALLALSRWIAEYYMAPIGEVIRLLLPPGGRASEAKRFILTDDGRRAAGGIRQALEPIELQGLALRERALLERLAMASEGGEKLTVLAREIDGARPALGVLEKRGLIVGAEALDVRQERREKAEPWVRLHALPAADKAVELFGRAPRRRAIWERISASGEISLAALRETDAQARKHVEHLAAEGLCVLEERVAERRDAAPESPDPFVLAMPEPGVPETLTDGQTAALAALEPAIDGERYAGFLLHGITGSGKTEVYLRAIARVLERGRGALVLVPEISLTPQLSARFRARFGDAVAVLHSNLGDRERFDAWMRLRSGKARIALGPRSAVFAPVRSLGIVVVDEEHDGSFKQEDGVRYHGRDVAMRRARDAGATAILGSATPSVETFHAARQGRLGLLPMPVRATPRPLPTVEIVDLRKHKVSVGSVGGLLSAPLVAALEETLAAGEQAILFLNRRGYATFILCSACGHRFACRNCAVTLTWHRAEDRLACHYCGHLEATPSRCPKCQAQSIERLGLGTERVEALVAERFPAARVARLDRDTAQGRGMARILESVRRRTVDVVIGTQMIAKGHDFPSVTLVGVVLADNGMNLPDFRADERTFQLLEQVAGRAGRGDRHGRVIIQTYTPDHLSVLRAQDHDYERFFEEERSRRQELSYPPYSRLGMIRVDGADEKSVVSASESVGAAAREMAARAPADAFIQVLGPSEAPLSRLKGKTRWQLFVKAAHPRGVRAVLSAAMGVQLPAGVRLSADIDPVSSL